MNIEELDYAQLAELRNKINSELSQRRANEVLAVIQKVREVIAKSGFSEKEILAGMKGKIQSIAIEGASPARLAAKYQHPSDKSLTWSGKGHRPQWVKAHLAKKGAKLDDLLIA